MGDEEAEDVIVLLKENVLKTCNELPYKVYNSVSSPILKPFRATGCTNRD